MWVQWLQWIKFLSTLPNFWTGTICEDQIPGVNNVWVSLFLPMTEKLKAASFKDRQEWSEWVLLFWGQSFPTYNAELCSLLVQLLIFYT